MHNPGGAGEHQLDLVLAVELVVVPSCLVVSLQPDLLQAAVLAGRCVHDPGGAGDPQLDLASVVEQVVAQTLVPTPELLLQRKN